MSKKQRKLFPIEGQALKVMENMKTKGGFKDLPDVLEYAIGLLEWAMKHGHEGKAIVAYDQNKHIMDILTVPFLHNKEKQEDSPASCLMHYMNEGYIPGL